MLVGMCANERSLADSSEVALPRSLYSSFEHSNGFLANIDQIDATGFGSVNLWLKWKGTPRMPRRAGKT